MMPVNNIRPRPARSTWLLVATVIVSAFPEWAGALIGWLTDQPRFLWMPSNSFTVPAAYLLWPALVAPLGLGFGLKAYRQEQSLIDASPLAVELSSHSDLEIHFWIDHIKLVVHNTSSRPLENVRVEIGRIEAHPPAAHDFDLVQRTLATDDGGDGVLPNRSSAQFDLMTVKTRGGCRQLLFQGWQDVIRLEDGAEAVKARQRYSLALRVTADGTPPLDAVVDIQFKPHPTLEDDAHSMPFPHGFQIALKSQRSAAHRQTPRFHPAAMKVA